MEFGRGTAPSFTATTRIGSRFGGSRVQVSLSLVETRTPITKTYRKSASGKCEKPAFELLGYGKRLQAHATLSTITAVR